MTYNIPDKNVTYISRARELWKERNDIAYLYGAKGQRCTESVFDALWNAEPNYFKKYTAAEKKRIKEFCMGKRLMDCSGFINECVGDFKYSTAYIDSCINVTSPDKTKDGDLLYTTFGGTGRHIGIDLGHGFFMHCPSEGKTLEIGVIADFQWEKGGTLL